MYISDLQHIEAATATEVKGGTNRTCGTSYDYNPYYSRPKNVAGANAGVEAFGQNTNPFTNTGGTVYCYHGVNSEF